MTTYMHAHRSRLLLVALVEAAIVCLFIIATTAGSGGPSPTTPPAPTQATTEWISQRGM